MFFNMEIHKKQEQDIQSISKIIFTSLDSKDIQMIKNLVMLDMVLIIHPLNFIGTLNILALISNTIIA